ncbi:DNA-binding Xre family transcriptional regulator [Evansella vedderi]|uniref:DNA-binding Xre family transcriptional regulator n=1 Tax=Evansella vedderi TaxID=38282 RepID=A0ABU0A378_9BACI|nr:helix-turn-helix transcriptional regulator [Evansella vedderi]MDQ0257944.1 DNA-binding Xre family transcriptional regulator [Evansella vedderi]
MKIKLKDESKFNELVIKKGWSKNKLSVEAKLSQPTVVQISKGVRNPTPLSAKKLCDALEVSFDEIFEIIDEKEAVTI